MSTATALSCHVTYTLPLLAANSLGYRSPARVMLALFALVGVCGAVILTKLYHRIKDMQNASLLGSVVPYGRRHKAIPRHGQRVQLSPCEVALVKASMEFRGATRITVVALMSGPEIAEPLAREALAR